MIKRLLKLVAILLAVVIVIVGGYVAYVFLAYHRLPDVDTGLTFDDGKDTGDVADDRPAPGTAYDIVTWNLGFGAYSADFSFFMDGGTESRAYSKAAVEQNIGHAVDVLKAEDPDFKLLQEVDIGSTRSYQVNEVALIEDALSDEGAPVFYSCFAQNYDSPYLFYPITRPHGASRSGILTESAFPIVRRVRRSLPVETGFMKLLDLDRCYSKSYIDTNAGGRQLVLYNLHLSAYTSDGTIATEQLKLLCADMFEEYEAGNYCIAGGDFNKDLPGNAGEVFGVSSESYTWAQPLQKELIPEGLKLVDALDAANPVPSCRNCDTGYIPGQTFVLIVDGFIVSDNVTVQDCHVIDEGFACSDHNPVKMTFTLNA